MLQFGYCLLLFSLPIAKPREACSVPHNPENGKFDCKLEDDNLNCDLLCSSGLSSHPRSWISCSSSSNWTTSPRSLICSPSVLLVSGSAWQLNIQAVELFSLNLSCPSWHLPDMPIWNFGHSLDYVDGNIFLCCSDWYSSENDACWVMNEDYTWAMSLYRLNQPRNNHASAVVGSKLFLIGGEGDKKSTEVMDLQQSTSWQPGFEMIEDLVEGCAVILSDGRVAVLGRWRSILGPLIPLWFEDDGSIIYNM